MDGPVKSEPSNVSGPRVMIGGLYRCCIASIYEAADRGELEQHEGARFKCPHCRDSWMVFHKDAWQWDSTYTEPKQ